MAKTLYEDILIASGGATRPRQSPLTAFVPIAVAVAGVVSIMLGGVSARNDRTVDAATVVDPITTGSIASETQTQSVPGHAQERE
ncbi:MAG: hypothetical protein ABI399_03655 [Bauldia sp.]